MAVTEKQLRILRQNGEEYRRLTRESIKNGLVELLKNQRYSDITMSDIIRKSGSSVLWVGGFAVIAGAGLRFPCIIAESSNDHFSLSLGTCSSPSSCNKHVPDFAQSPEMKAFSLSY